MSGIDDAARILGSRAVRDEPIGPRTTYRVGGAAALFLEANDEDDVALARRAVRATGIPVLVVGRGSNLLVADRGFPGLAVSLAGEFDDIAVDGTTVRAGGAVSLPVLARRTAKAGLTGLEWAVGVPGSVGGAVRMNAGGHGSETVETLRRYRLVDLAGELDGVFGLDDLDAGYRRTSVAPSQVVLWGEFELERGDADEAGRVISEIVRWRRDNQPGGQNCGSVFTNPPGDSAGRLIEAAGLKGFRVGSAHVSEKHANFFQADDGGSADDVRQLIREVQRRVAEVHGVNLHPELQMVGFPDSPSTGGRG